MKKLSLLLTLLMLLNSISVTFIQAEEEPDIHSEAGIIIDGNTGQILYQKNPHKQLNPASITKLLTALIAIENLSPEDTMTFSKESIDSLDYGSSRIGIKEGEIITVEDAMHGLLLMSANEVANALAEESSGSISEFVIDMNAKAKDLGATNSNFENPHGLYESNHYTTVYDMALITKEIIKNDYFLEIMSHTMYQIPETNLSDEIRYLSQQHKMVNNKNDMRIYREDVIGGKIGYTSESGHTLVTAATQADLSLIVVIMKTDANSLYSDTEKLLDYGFSNFTQATIDPNKYETTVSFSENNVVLGDILLATTQTPDLLLPDGYDKDTLEFQYDIDENLSTYSSVVGDLGGSCKVILNGEITLEQPLYIKDINQVVIETQEIVSEVNKVEEVIEGEPADKPKSFMPLVLILLTFSALTVICIPKNRR